MPDDNTEYFEKAAPEEKRQSSDDDSGKGPPRRDDEVSPEAPGRSEFGTHGGPHGKGDLRHAEREQ